MARWSAATEVTNVIFTTRRSFSAYTNLTCNSECFVKIEWTYEKRAVPAPTSTAPVLTFSYTPDSAKIENGYYTGETDVDVTVKIGSTDYTADTQFAWSGESCGAAEKESAADKKFRVHLKTCQLTVVKAAGHGELYDAGDTFVFTVKGASGMMKDKKTTAVIKGTGSQTITGLLIGSYTVTEDTNWSWRYNADGNNASAQLTPDRASQAVTITNTAKEKKWLTADAMAVNVVEDGKAVRKEGENQCFFQWKA